MPDRKDALAAAAEIILAIESLARSSGSIDTVATIGICEVFPGAINSIPSRVTLSVDLRDTDAARRDRVLNGIISACNATASTRGLTITHQIINSDTPAKSDPAILDAITQSCAGISSIRMTSRAYHDSLFMSRIAPAAMIFIPCREGISHRPDEYASPAAIATGVLVLARTLATLAGAA